MDSLIQILLAYYIIDFISGVGHWIIDQYIPQDVEFGGESNANHHKFQGEIASRSYFEVTKETYYIAIILYILVLIGSFIFGYNPLNMFIITFFVLGVNVNEFHKWSHTSYNKLHPFIVFLQKYNILLGHDNHKRHHSVENHIIKGKFDVSYCLISGQLNYILDYFNFWNYAEIIIYNVSGLVANRHKNTIISYHDKN